MREFIPKLSFLAIKKRDLIQFLKRINDVDIEDLIDIVIEDLEYEVESMNLDLIDTNLLLYEDIFHTPNKIVDKDLLNNEIESMRKEIDYWREKFELSMEVERDQFERVVWYYFYRNIFYPFEELWFMKPEIKVSGDFLAFLEKTSFFRDYNFIREGLYKLPRFKYSRQLYGGDPGDFDMMVKEINKEHAHYISEVLKSQEPSKNIETEYLLWIDILDKVLRDELFFIVIQNS